MLHKKRYHVKHHAIILLDLTRFSKDYQCNQWFALPFRIPANVAFISHGTLKDSLISVFYSPNDNKSRV